MAFKGGTWGFFTVVLLALLGASAFMIIINYGLAFTTEGEHEAMDLINTAISTVFGNIPDDTTPPDDITPSENCNQACQLQFGASYSGTCRFSGTPPVEPPSDGELKTEGRWIKDSNNNVVFLRGVNRPGLNWIAKPGRDPATEIDWTEHAWDEIEKWGANYVRVPFTREYWEEGKNRLEMQQAIDWGAERGIYTDLSLIWWVRGDPITYPHEHDYSGQLMRMPPNIDDWIETWKEIANLYKDNPYVIFGPWNEPHDVTDEEWWDAIQLAIDAIRSTGAKNLIMVAVQGWSHDARPIRDNPNIDFLDGENLVYVYHQYAHEFGGHDTVQGIKDEIRDWGWDYVLDKAPIMVQEFGGDYRNQDEVEFVRLMTRIANGQENNDGTDWSMGYVAWWWLRIQDTGGGANAEGENHALLAYDWETPTASGQVLKNALAEGGTSGGGEGTSEDIILQDDFSTTQLVGGELTGWGEGHIYRPETISFAYDPENSGNRVLKVTAPGETATARSTEVIQYLSEAEYWVQVKILFPSDFLLTGVNEWFVFQGLMFEYVDEQNTLRIEPVFEGNELRFKLGRQKVENGMIVDSEDAITDFYFTRGVWHTMQYHVVRHPTNGVVEVWIDGTKVVNWRNIQTRFKQDEFNWIPVKHYTDVVESTKTVYFDDIILSKSPITTKPPSSTATCSSDEKSIDQNGCSSGVCCCKQSEEPTTTSTNIPLIGFSGYFSSISEIDNVLNLMSENNMKIFRLPYNPSWASTVHPYRFSYIEHYLENTPDDWIIIVDRNHVYPPDSSGAVRFMQNYQTAINDIISTQNQVENLEQTNNKEYSHRVWYELSNELSLTGPDSVLSRFNLESNGYDFYDTMDDMTMKLRQAGITNILVMDRFWMHTYDKINDPQNKFYQGIHAYFNDETVESAKADMQHFIDNGVTWMANTEVGADYRERNEFDSSEVAELNEFLEYCYDRSISDPDIIIINFIWLREDDENWQRYKDLGLVIPPASSTCSCTGWVSRSCGGGSCSSTQRQRTRTCTPTGCTPSDGLGTSRCVADASCGSSSPSLSVSASPSSIPVGGTSTLTAQTNPSYPTLYIAFSTNLGTIDRSGCTADANGKCSRTISSSSPGTATVTVNAGAGYDSDTTTVTFSGDSCMAMGINYISGGNAWSESDSQLNADFSRFANDGIKHISVRVMWSVMEPNYNSGNAQLSTGNLNNIKRVLNAANNNGIKVNLDFWTQFGWNLGFPSWAGTNYFSLLLNPTKSYWLRYVKAVVAELKDYPALESWAILNEPWYNTADQRAPMEQLIRDTYDAIESVDNSHTIICRFTLSYTPGSGKYSDSLYDVFDVFALTIYLDPSNPNANEGNGRWSHWDNTISDLKTRNKSLWIIEFGDDNTNLEQNRIHYTQSLQKFEEAGIVQRAYAWAWETRRTGLDEGFNIYGAGGPEPAYDELVDFQSQIDQTCTGGTTSDGFGVGVNYYFWDAPSNSRIESDFEMFRQHGIKYVSVRLIWQVLEPVLGQYSTSTLNALRQILTVAEQKGINVQIDFHTITPSALWTVPYLQVGGQISGSTRQIATNPTYRQYYLNMIDYYTKGLASYPKHSYSILNEAGRVESNSDTQLYNQWMDYWDDAVAVVQSNDPESKVTFRYSLPDSPYAINGPVFDAERYKNTFDYISINHYLDGRYDNSVAWDSNWQSVEDAVADAHNAGMELWATEWGGNENGPVKTVAFYQATLQKMKDLGVDVALAFMYVPAPQGGTEEWNIRDYPELFDVMQSFASESQQTTCSCTDWVSGSCGGGSCSSTQRQRTRTCTPSGCIASDGYGASRCVADSSCGSTLPTYELPDFPSITWAQWRDRAEKESLWMELWNAHGLSNKIHVAGKSVQGRNIYLFEAGNPNAPALFIDAQLHGNEDHAHEILLRFAYWLLNGEDTGDATAQDIMQNNRVLFMPIVNTDMSNIYTNTFKRCNANNVNLNRNFVEGWGRNGGNDPVNCGALGDYMGPSAGSEPETQTVKNVFRTYSPMVYINLHTGLQMASAYGNQALANQIIQGAPSFSSYFRAGHTSSTGRAYSVTDAIVDSPGSSAWLIEFFPNNWRHEQANLNMIEDTYYPRFKEFMISAFNAIQN